MRSPDLGKQMPLFHTSGALAPWFSIHTVFSSCIRLHRTEIVAFINLQRVLKCLAALRHVRSCHSRSLQMSLLCHLWRHYTLKYRKCRKAALEEERLKNYLSIYIYTHTHIRYAITSWWGTAKLPHPFPNSSVTRGPQMCSVGSATMLAEILARCVLMLLRSRRYKYIKGTVPFSIARYTLIWGWVLLAFQSSILSYRIRQGRESLYSY